ncbi:serine hydrolase domain-containing protein [Dyella caseinilytica]|uniref:Serine hydrolase n=1 Tax=Dyella caseinilytica TaxID=1849581 RepID=A0ABX7GY85_9GAMM|nr:serine hydrolase [Dyella caseinilytica]QRN55367.1 serine hydrolase [Dyella caseinilytica]GGA01209.1 serine hydrolase [Dyella caseinilytica]
MMKRVMVVTGVGLLVVVVAFIAIRRPGRAALVGAGMAAHNLCSATFVAGLDPDATLQELVRPVIGEPLGRFVHYRIDRADQSVETTFLGVFHAHAHFTPGYGCRMVFADTPPAPAPRALLPAEVSDGFAPAGPVMSTDPSLNTALDHVFDEHPGEPIKDVKAVVIVKNGHVIAERYAPGFGVNTPLLSYSVAKSFTNALLGVLVRQGRLRVDQPVGAPEWQRTGDSRAHITIEDLLRMRSGLDIEESDSGFDPVGRMEFLHDDMAGYAAQQPLRVPIGSEWDYTSGNTLIIDRLMGQTVGGGAKGMRDFAEEELLEPAHLSNLTMEFDGSGVFFGSSYVYAPARTYARFGELYLHDGVAPNGQRILPEGWVAWSRRSTLGTPYGAGFWTNDGPSRVAAWRVAHGFPKDGFFASGFLGQRIYIVPSEQLVVVRFGYSRPPDFGIEDDVALIAAAIHATHGQVKDVATQR